MTTQENGGRQVGNQIRFLYKFSPGVTLCSFGIHVAQIAGLMPRVLEKAEEVSLKFNKSIQAIKMFKKSKLIN